MIHPVLSFRRLLAVTTALSMALPAASFAQDADSSGAPPSTVGQITSISGSVSFNNSGSGGWAAAADNYPVSAGDSLYTQDNSGAGIVLNTSQITLASDTELQVTALDSQNFSATQSQGEVAYAINDLQPGQSFTITTPRGSVSISQNGQVDVISGDANDPTVVNVFQGAATITAPGATLQVAAGQSGVLSGSDQTVAQLGQAQQDNFSSTAFAENTSPPPSYAPPVVNQMTGTAELGQYGAWQQSPQYGAVWYPAVSAGWTPYREGHWADIQPWGWTWVENEPWGFAPFHYGRWVDYDGRWGWAPAPAYSEGYSGPSYQPVYAPAVVSFFGVALAAGITAAVLSSGSVGWVPLAPNEPYYPSYHCPPAYIRQINRVSVRNINDVHVTNITNMTTNNYYGQLANRRAATVIPAGVMSRGEHVAGYAHTPPQNVLAAARPIDSGFGGHASAQQAAFRLPAPARPLAELRPAPAPHATAFAERRSLPPATISHAPFTGHGEAAPRALSTAIPMGNRPEFAPAFGYHAPPAPPQTGEHLGALPPANSHPEAENHMAPPTAYRPENTPFHPQAEQHPFGAPQSHPAAQAYHPPAPEYHPPAESYHPPAPAYRPPPEQFHPQAVAQPRQIEAPRPDQHAEPGHAEPQKHPGG